MNKKLTQHLIVILSLLINQVLFLGDVNLDNKISLQVNFLYILDPFIELINFFFYSAIC